MATTLKWFALSTDFQSSVTKRIKPDENYRFTLTGRNKIDNQKHSVTELCYSERRNR